METEANEVQRDVHHHVERPAKEWLRRHRERLRTESEYRDQWLVGLDKLSEIPGPVGKLGRVLGHVHGILTEIQ